MDTKRLYLEGDAPLEFACSVVAVRPGAFATDVTCFYAASGGQPSDGGKFCADGDSEPYEVVEVAHEGFLTWHHIRTDGPALLPVSTGMRLRGVVDGARRRVLSGHHTALHVLNAIALRDWGARVTGAQIQPDRSRMDFQFGAVSADLKQALQTALDVEIDMRRPVSICELTRAEFLADPTLVRTVNRSVPLGPTVRIVAIDGLDRQACGGTHLTSLGELRRVTVQKLDNKGACNKRAYVTVDLA